MGACWQSLRAGNRPRRGAAGATIKGCTRVGLRLLVFTVHPMQPGATLMSSFLFNVALVLLATNAAIQFCAQAFALYANETAIHDIWGNQARCVLQQKEWRMQVLSMPTVMSAEGRACCRHLGRHAPACALQVGLPYSTLSPTSQHTQAGGVLLQLPVPARARRS